MSIRKKYLSLGTVCFGAFIFFSYLVHKNLFVHLDFNTTVRLQDHISRRFDFPFSVLSTIGQFEIMTVVLLSIFIITRRWKAGIVSLGLFVAFHLIEIYGKYFVHHRPPPQFMLRTMQIVQFSPFTIREVNSYPSGHSGRTMFISVIGFILIWQSKKLSPQAKLILTAFIIAYDITMLASRIYLGEHWLSDVIGGSLLGSALGLFTGIFLIDKTTKSHSVQPEKKKSWFPKYKLELKRVE